ncbi:universal stress protein [Helicobacter apodemus]|uniref:Universal stress protein n=1 Tax=Helicobacter apodemus TaxID=135569 RepID=A0A4U8UH47_9HELI|nr:universal stress protein [Helicobacter apodemus]TLE14170.1 universal stress protein [Helicobacter apodemus]
MKNRIAVATDFSQNSLIAISKALYLAKKSKSTLDVVHIVEHSIFHDPKQSKRTGKEALAKFILEHFPNPEVVIQEFCYVGSIVKGICKHIKERECKLLCVGSAGENHHLTEILLGSTAKQIVKKSQIPVLVTKNESLPDYINAFSPTDFSNNSLKLAKVTKKLFDNIKITFYHMINRPFEIRLGHYGADDEQISKYNKSAEEKAKEQSKKFLKELDKNNVNMVLDSGILTYTRLLSVAESKNSSLVVLPTSGKVSFFALDVLEHSNLDVLICKF